MSIGPRDLGRREGRKEGEEEERGEEGEEGEGRKRERGGGGEGGRRMRKRIMERGRNKEGDIHSKQAYMPNAHSLHNVRREGWVQSSHTRYIPDVGEVEEEQ